MFALQNAVLNEKEKCKLYGTLPIQKNFAHMTAAKKFTATLLKL
jgi:hypothetical protein